MSVKEVRVGGPTTGGAARQQKRRLRSPRGGRRMGRRGARGCEEKEGTDHALT
jgi:hypothetical protein